MAHAHTWAHTLAVAAYEDNVTLSPNHSSASPSLWNLARYFPSGLSTISWGCRWNLESLKPVGFPAYQHTLKSRPCVCQMTVECKTLSLGSTCRSHNSSAIPILSWSSLHKYRPCPRFCPQLSTLLFLFVFFFTFSFKVLIPSPIWSYHSFSLPWQSCCIQGVYVRTCLPPALADARFFLSSSKCLLQIPGLTSICLLCLLNPVSPPPHFFWTNF